MSLTWVGLHADTRSSGSNGANLLFPRALGIGTHSAHDKYLVGLINAAPYIGSAFLGCWASDPLNSYFGRRGTIFITANFCLWSVIGSAFAQTWEQVLVCRLLLGIGMGAKASTVPIFAGENSVLCMVIHRFLCVTCYTSVRHIH